MSNLNVVEQIVEVDPSLILQDDNVRFGLKADRVDDLADSIKEMGRITTPLWIEPLETPVEGKSHRLTAGNYRLAATLKLNKEGAGLLVPCIVRPAEDAVSRMKTQLSENLDRNSMTPMDKATAIKKLLDAGVPRIEIRKLFATTGGRKGNKKQPVSNSFLNMMVSFLQFPKAIQNKIHLGTEEGGIGVATAYALTKITKDKWESVLKEAEEMRLKVVARQEADEEQYLKDEAKKVEAEKKANELSEELAVKKEALQKASAELDTLNEKQKELYSASKIKVLNEEDKAKAAAAAEALKALEAEAKEKQKAAQDLQKETEKLTGKTETAQKTAQERADRLKELRLKTQNSKKKDATPTPGDIQAAAANQGAATGYVPPKITQIHKDVADWALPGATPKMILLADIFKRYLSGQLTPNMAQWEITYSVTGENKTRPKHMGKEPKMVKDASK